MGRMEAFMPNPNEGIDYGLTTAQSYDGHNRGEHPTYTVARLANEEEQRRINERFGDLAKGGSSSGGEWTRSGSSHGFRSALGVLIKVGLIAGIGLTLLLAIAVAIPQSRSQTFMGLSILTAIPLELAPGAFRDESPTASISRNLRIKPVAQRLNVKVMRAFDQRVLKGGKHWASLSIKEKSFLLATFRAKTQWEREEYFILLEESEQARYSLAFADMINEAAALDPVLANRTWTILEPGDDLSEGVMRQLEDTPFSGGWRDKCLWLSNKIYYRAVRAKQVRVANSAAG